MSKDNIITPFPSRKKPPKRFRLYDAATGEVAGDFVSIEHRRRSPLSALYGPNWAALTMTGFAELRDADLRGSDYRVLMHMLGKLEVGNHIRSRIVDLARELEMKPSNVSASLRRLLDEQIIVRRSDFGWRLHPRMGFRGDPTGMVAKRKNGELVLL